MNASGVRVTMVNVRIRMEATDVIAIWDLPAKIAMSWSSIVLEILAKMEELVSTAMMATLVTVHQVKTTEKY